MKKNFRKVLKHFDSKRDMARKLGVHATMVSKMERDDWIPWQQCIKLSELTGIPLHELNPKVYPRA